MIKNITEAKTSQDIKDIIHPQLLASIPANDLDKIAQRILLDEQIFVGKAVADPTEVTVARIYSSSINQIIRIEYGEDTYQI